MRSPDLKFHLKIEFLVWTDLETLNQLSFEAKVEETSKPKIFKANFFHLTILINFMKAVKICQHPEPEGLLKFLFLESSNGKICLKKFHILIVSSTK